MLSQLYTRNSPGEHSTAAPSSPPGPTAPDRGGGGNASLVYCLCRLDYGLPLVQQYSHGSRTKNIRTLRDSYHAGASLPTF